MVAVNPAAVAKISPDALEDTSLAMDIRSSVLALDVIGSETHAGKLAFALKEWGESDSDF